MTTISAAPLADLDTLRNNLAALARSSPRAAEIIARTPPRPDIEFIDTTDPLAPSATLAGLSLASRRRPREEAQRLAGSIDLEHNGLIIIHGLALGHHARALAQRMGDHTVALIHEPDPALLRAVFERIDHSDWLASGRFRLLIDAPDTGALTAALRSWEAPLSIGVAFLTHPPSASRLAPHIPPFEAALSRAIGALRTNIITTLMQTDVTMRNAVMNADRYLAHSGIADLRGACAGLPAIIVSAGPSLARTIDHLTDPALRDRCIIVAVQTALKPLLERGIRPHFITALDYAEISTRFYEGLTADDVRGITLIAEAKANPAILSAFPGATRIPADDMCDLILGEALAPHALGASRGKIPAGATVAHLACYIARHLACDPIILTGQDLAFTDGQYYADNAAIHHTWAAELNPFRSIEAMEWERIARMRGHLHKATDHLGRDIYTDDQMLTYLAQFERDFGEDTARGLRIIDATEGGIRKAHTTTMTLAEAIRQFAPAGAPAIPDLSPLPAPAAPLTGLRDRMRSTRLDVRRIGRCSREAIDLLRKLRDATDYTKANRLVTKIHDLRDQATSATDAFKLLCKLNQSGALKRFRADRAIALAEGLDPAEIQRRRADRDIVNLEWLSESADFLDTLLDDADAVFEGAPRRTRDAAPARAGERPARQSSTTALITIEPDATHHTIGGRSMLRATLDRLAMCTELDAAIIIIPPGHTLPADALDPALTLRTIIHESPLVLDPTTRAAARARRSSRLWSASCWRSGISHTSLFDEIFDPAIAADALATHTFTAALIIGHDWPALDPSICSAIIRQHTQSPDQYRLTFSQAAPGLAGCVIAASTIAAMRDAQASNAFATIGGTLAYTPARPSPDPIALPPCTQIPPLARDLHFRAVADSPSSRDILERAASIDPQLSPASLGRALGLAGPSWAPREIIVELTTRRNLGGERRTWFTRNGAVPAREDMMPARVRAVLDACADFLPHCAISFAGSGDPLNHPGLPEFIALAKQRGAAGIHIRTDMLCTAAALDAALDAGADAISVDLLANTAATYARLTGADRYREALERCDQVLQRRTVARGWPSIFLVPRITRCDAVYGELEAFYDKWLIIAGAAAIDPLPRPMPGQRIAPFTIPRPALEREARERLFILADGSITGSPRDTWGDTTIANIADRGWIDAWRAAVIPRESGAVL